MNEWALGKTGRNVFQHMATPKQNDHLDTLERRKQVILFRLRAQHIPLNFHLSRILQPGKETHCILCPHPYGTVPHILFECPALDNLRNTFLPSKPNLQNTLLQSRATQENPHLLCHGNKSKGTSPNDCWIGKGKGKE